jgi:tetratricopeptide (TPR) repeat protein
MADRKKIAPRVRRSVFFRAHGRCEYGSCSKISAKWDDGSVAAVGAFSHILPVGDAGPRWRFKKDFPDIDIDGADNLILLCEEHHHLVDRDEVEKHPPALLFELSRRKQEYIAHAVDDFFISSPFRFEHEELLEDVRIGRIFDFINEAQLAGPRRGRGILRQAEALLRDVIKNPFIKVPEEYLELIKLELTIHGSLNAYRPDQWRTALQRATASLRKFSEKKKVAAAVLLCGVFVRDEYGVFSSEERLGFIKLLLDRLDPLITKDEEPAFASFLLGLKAGLMRWRGRLLRSTAQQNSFSEAGRCAELSLTRKRSAAGLMQLCLIKHTEARTLTLDELSKYEEKIATARAILSSTELDELSAATKYRARFYRDIYEFQKGIEYFWRGVDLGYLSDCRRTAFILGECSSSSYSYVSKDETLLLRAAEFLHDSISAGYDHERNFMSWITCKGMLDPQWFREEVHAKFNPDGQLIDFVKFLHGDATRYFGAEAFAQDAFFGIDESEFWNMLGRLCRTALADPDAALQYYERAERHDRSPGGNFTTKVGRVRAYIHKGQPEIAGRYLKMARTTARAYQARIIFDLQSELDRATFG